jgi:hypothetical protein
VRKSLRNLNGTEITKLPFEISRVGDLLFFRSALISVYKDIALNIYIKSWLEEYNGIVRSAFFQIRPYMLLDYLKGDIPYSDILLSPIDNLYFIQDNNYLEKTNKVTVLSSINFHRDYIPKVKAYFDEEDSEDADIIRETFGLDKLDLEEQPSVFNILEEAKSNESDLVNIHLSSKNSVVGYGKIQSHVLGEALMNYHKVAEATVISLYAPRRKENSNKPNVTLDNIKKLAITEYSYSRAASFSAFLKPYKIVKEADGETSFSKIQTTIFSLFSIGENYSDIKEHPEFSEEMLNAYSSLLKVVTDNDVNLTIQYGNLDDDSSYSEHFNKIKALKIISNLSSPHISEKVQTVHTGYFDTVSNRKKSFEFVSGDGHIYEGKFAFELHQAVASYRLDLKYKVTMTTQDESMVGRKKLVKRHIILASSIVED